MHDTPNDRPELCVGSVAISAGRLLLVQSGTLKVGEERDSDYAAA